MEPDGWDTSFWRVKAPVGRPAGALTAPDPMSIVLSHLGRHFQSEAALERLCRLGRPAHTPQTLTDTARLRKEPALKVRGVAGYFRGDSAAPGEELAIR
jgi:hypothetical protein